MMKIIDSDALHEVADEILSQVAWLDSLDDDEGDQIGYYTPILSALAYDLKELADGSQAAPAEDKQ